MIKNSDIDALVGATAYGPGGDKLGKVGEVYLDNRTGNPAWITVVTGLFGTRRHFVPIEDAELDGRDVRLPFDKDTVTGAPNIDEDGRLTPEEESRLYRYYDRADTGDAGRTPDVHDTSGTDRGPQAGAPGVATSAPPSSAPGPTPASSQPASSQPGGATGADEQDAASAGPRLRKRVVTTEYYVDDDASGTQPPAG